MRVYCFSLSFDGVSSCPTIIRYFLEWHTVFGGVGDNPRGGLRRLA